MNPPHHRIDLFGPRQLRYIIQGIDYTAMSTPGYNRRPATRLHKQYLIVSQ